MKIYKKYQNKNIILIKYFDKNIFIKRKGKNAWVSQEEISRNARRNFIRCAAAFGKMALFFSADISQIYIFFFFQGRKYFSKYLQLSQVCERKKNKFSFSFICGVKHVPYRTFHVVNKRKKEMIFFVFTDLNRCEYCVKFIHVHIYI